MAPVVCGMKSKLPAWHWSLPSPSSVVFPTVFINLYSGSSHYKWLLSVQASVSSLLLCSNLLSFQRVPCHFHLMNPVHLLGLAQRPPSAWNLLWLPSSRFKVTPLSSMFHSTLKLLWHIISHLIISPFKFNFSLIHSLKKYLSSCHMRALFLVTHLHWRSRQAVKINKPE